MAFDLDIQHLRKRARLHQRGDHGAIRHRNTEPVAGGFDDEIEQVEFQSALRVGLGKASRVQPALLGEITLVGRRQHMQEGKAGEIDRFAATETWQERRGADGDMAFGKQPL